MSSSIYVDIHSLKFDEHSVYRQMGYGETLPDDNVCNITRYLINSSYSIVKPSFYYSIFQCLVNKESIKIGSCEFNTNRTISTLLRKSEKIALFVATAGEEFQEWFNSIKASDDSLKMFVTDALGSVIVEATGDFMEDYLENNIIIFFIFTGCNSKKHFNILEK